MSRPRGPPRPSHSKGNMATSCRIWRCKSSERRAEVKLTSSPPARLLCMPAYQSSRVLWLLPTTFYWGRHLHHLHSSYCTRASPVEEQPASAAPPTPVPKQSPRLQKMAPFPRSCGEHAFGRNHFEGDSGRTPQLQAARDPTLGQSTQAEPCRGIWLQDSDLVKEARREFFSKHSYNFITGGHLQSLRDI